MRGAVVDDQTRCVHYASELDVVAIRFRCCDTYYPCHACHAEAVDHPAERWPADELAATALAMAEAIAANPPLAVRYTKAALNQPLKRALLDSVEVAVPYELVTFLSADHAEAVEAAKARRPGTYGGR